jgi:hypothetical protein
MPRRFLKNSVTWGLAMTSKSRTIVIQSCVAFGAAALANVAAVPFLANKDMRIGLIGLSLILFLYFVAVVTNTDVYKPDRHHELELLKRTKAFWIEPFLRKLTDGPLWLQINTRWSRLDHSKKTSKAIPLKTNIVEVFAEANRSLVILGNPGSGKTITMLLLAKALAVAATVDKREPIPVVFNLSSWSTQYPSFFEWLLSELREKYFVPKRMGRRFLDHNRLLLLLDGLDEVGDSKRASCVQAINLFIRRPSISRIQFVVCCRREEYLTLTERIEAREMELEELAEGEVRRYVVQSSPNGAEIKKALEENETLDAVSRSPLMLNFIRAVYETPSSGLIPKKWPTRIRECRDSVLDAYIETKLAQLSTSVKSGDKWLSWLGGHMYRDSQSVFLSEHLQPIWLSSDSEKYTYVILSRMISALIVVLLGVGIMVLSQGASSLMWIGEAKPTLPPIGLIDVRDGLWSWVAITGGLGGLVFGLIDLAILLSTDSSWVRKYFPSGSKFLSFVSAAFNVGICTLVFFLAAALRFNIGKGIYGGMIYGVAFGLVFWFRGREQTLASDIKTADRLAWSWAGLPRGLGWGLIAGSIIGSGVGLVVALISGAKAGKYIALLSLAGAVLIGGILGVLKKVSVGERKTSPNQGINMSMLNTFWIFVYVGLPCLVLFWIVGGVLKGSTRLPFESAMFFGLVLGLLVAFSYAGLDVIYHYVLRGILTLSQGLPFRYLGLLDQATALGLLRRVGGAYVFYHPLLKERMALHDQPSKSEPGGQQRGRRRSRKHVEHSLRSLIAAV